MKDRLKMIAVVIGVTATGCAVLYGYRMLFHGQKGFSVEAQASPAKDETGGYPTRSPRAADEDTSVPSVADVSVTGTSATLTDGWDKVAPLAAPPQSGIVAGVATATTAEIPPDAGGDAGDGDLPYCP